MVDLDKDSTLLWSGLGVADAQHLGGKCNLACRGQTISVYISMAMNTEQ